MILFEFGVEHQLISLGRVTLEEWTSVASKGMSISPSEDGPVKRPSVADNQYSPYACCSEQVGHGMMLPTP